MMIEGGGFQRDEWPLAAVTKSTVDDDGLVRHVVTVGTKNLDAIGKRANMFPC